LKITPHISRERQVRLNISLEISVLEDPDQTTLQPTTLKRTVDTTVIVQDKSTVVIGGLIDHTRADVETKVPLLGDIPLLGWLFKYRSERNEKQNLFVFLTPHVIKNPEEAENVYGRKKIQMDSLQEGRIKLFNKKQSDTDME
jgi:general secretion pathway protein D